MSTKISDLPAYSGELQTEGSVPVSILGVTYRATPSQISRQSLFIEKAEQSIFLLTGTGIITDFVLPDKKGVIVFNDAITQLNSFNYAVLPFNGKKIVLHNKQTTDVLIKNATGTQIYFNFPDNLDFVLKPDQAIEFFYTLDYAPFSHHKYIGVVLSGKLDKSTYIGNAQTLKDSIDLLKTIITPLKSKFILVHKSTNTDNNIIELNDLARGYGPGTGIELEYWYLAQYLNLTADGNSDNYQNYKPVTVALPNS